MKLLVISDLHLGNDDHFGTFQWNQRDFLRVLNDTIRRYQVDQLILNGDILEMMKYPYRKIMLHNREIIKYFFQQKAIWIKGNHDILNPLAQDSYQYHNKNGQTIYIEHGNKADFLNGTRFGRTLGRVLLSLLRKLIRYRNFYAVYYRTLLNFEQINRVPKKYNTYKYMQYALKLLKSYDVVILGHTHKLESHHTYYLQRKKRYINSGSCSMNRFQAILIDTETLVYKMINLQSVEDNGKATSRKQTIPEKTVTAPDMVQPEAELAVY